MSTPTPEQLERWMDLVVSGEESEDAIAVIWPEDEQVLAEAKTSVRIADLEARLSDALTALETANAAPPPPAVTRMVTEFADGLIIGWDTCALGNGGCGLHVNACRCNGGPRELKVFSQWRAGERLHLLGDVGEGLGANAAPMPAPTLVLEPGNDGMPPADAAAVQGLVPCREGEHFVKQDEADRNDDMTFTCWACQEAGVQKARA